MLRNILLLSEKDFLTLPVIRSLKRSDFRVFVAGPRVSPARFSRFCHKYFAYSQRVNKNEALFEYINRISAECAIDIIIPLDLESTLWVAKSRHQLTARVLPVSDADVILRLHNKWELTKILDEFLIAYPKTILIEDENDLVEGVADYPFLVKPLDKDGCQGIFRIDDLTDLQKYRANKLGGGEFPILAQQYIDGFDIDMSLLAVNGKIVSWTIQKWDRPGILKFVINQEVYAICEKIVSREKYSGLAHIDLRIDGGTGEVFVLEFNPRAWGSISASMQAGVDFVASAVHSALHKPIPNQKASAVSYILFAKLLKFIFTRPWALRDISPISWKDFIAVLSDPIPYICLYWIILRENDK